MTPTELWLRDVSRVSQVPTTTLIGRGRERNVVRLRQALMFVMVRKCKLSYPEAGRRLGGLDHSTVIHGVRTLEDFLRRGDPAALRAYRIVIRSFVRVQQAERASRNQMKQLMSLSEEPANDYADYHAGEVPGAVPVLWRPAHGQEPAAAGKGRGELQVRG